MITIPLLPEYVTGVAELATTTRGRQPHRLPPWVRSRFPDPQILMMESQPSGVRVAFTTNAQRIELVTHPTRLVYRGATRPRGSIDLVVDDQVIGSDLLDGGDVIQADLVTGETRMLAGESHTSLFLLPAGEKSVEIWLPHNESVELVSLRSDAPVAPARINRRVWLHHGSSISHGSNAATPTQIWPAVAARRAGVHLHNLGLGGSALVDQFTARVMRDTPSDVISVKLGINVVNLDAMRLRAFVPAVHGFLDTIREGHPDTPLMLISPIFCEIHEDTPGPGRVDASTLGTDHVRFAASDAPPGHGRLTLRVIRDALDSLVERRSDDAMLHYLDGTRLYGPHDAEIHPLPDALHPDTATHRLIGERFADYAFGENGFFAAYS